ncbi:MAG TPA: glycosyltransferase [Candidatus Kapabacteria bacterium]|nr:glycosyltransferase [Candidatus Kapabacteria bacterium]
MAFLNIGIIFCLAAVGYCYLFYPLVIRLLAMWFPRPLSNDESYRPTVSVILSVHNEEKVIERCIDSVLALDYPRDRLEIIIGSDGSTDRTNEILKSYQSLSPIFRLHLYSEQRGKITVLNDIISLSTGEILFFIDADIELAPNALAAQVSHYIDNTIGAVAGSYEIGSADRSSLFASEREYLTLEQQIRDSESRFYSTVGLAGCNYTVRRSLWQPLPDTLVHDDLYMVLSVLDKNHRVAFEQRSIATERFARTLREEFRRKSRFASRGYHTFAFFPKLILPRAGRTAFILWSHKLLRWSSPFFALTLVGLATLGFAVTSLLIYKVILICAAVISGFALIGFAAEMAGVSIPVLRQLSWLFVMNAAYVVGTIKYITRSDEEIWRSSSRGSVHKSHGLGSAL